MNEQESTSIESLAPPTVPYSVNAGRYSRPNTNAWWVYKREFALDQTIRIWVVVGFVAVLLLWGFLWYIMHEAGIALAASQQARYESLQDIGFLLFSVAWFSPLIVWTAPSTIRMLILRRRRATHHCLSCGYQLPHVESVLWNSVGTDHHCPECGWDDDIRVSVRFLGIGDHFDSV